MFCAAIGTTFLATSSYENVSRNNNVGLFSEVPWLDREVLVDLGFVSRYVYGLLPGDIPVG